MPTQVSSDQESDSQVARQIRAWRHALIDLTRRNPLLSLSLKSKSNLRLPEPSADDIFALLGRRRKSLLFVPDIPADQDVLFKAPRPPKTGATFVSAADLKTLNTMRQRAALMLQEQGINTLFVAIGLLEWPDPHTGTTLLSPLLLVPVTLERTSGDDTLRLRRLEDDVEVNPTLHYRLSQRDLQLALPVAPDEEGLVPSEYLQAVEALVGGHSGWSVRRECYIGRFSFLKLAMYRDLESLEEEARSHPLVAALAGDRAALRRLPSVTVPKAIEMDATTATREAFQVLDADPSQQRAIWAAREGQSFVLQGPPGTGKTQTIANIITECIAAGKRVLFVSQKMAALDAVFKRLRDTGLADLCLEAHSHKATKKEILQQLGRALNARDTPRPSRKGFLEELAESRRTLNEVAAELHCPREPLGLSMYEANGLVAGASDVPDLPFVFVAPEAVSSEDYRRLEQYAEQLASFHSLFRAVGSHPWRGVSATRFSLDLQTRVRITFGDMLTAIEGLEVSVKELAYACGLTPPLGVEGAEWLLQVASIACVTPKPPFAWLTDASVDTLRFLAEECRSRYNDFDRQRTALLVEYQDGMLTLPHHDLRDRLSTRHEFVLRAAFGVDWAHKAADNGKELSELFLRLTIDAERLGRCLTALASLCGLSPVDTVAFGRRALHVAGLACADPRPQPGWFEVGAMPSLLRHCDEARAYHEGFAARNAELMVRYTERILQLDLDALAPRFRDEYAGLVRYFKRGFYRDRRLVHAALRLGVAPPADLASDIQLAQEVAERRAWIRANEARLTTTFGIHYRGMETDWDALKGALRKSEELAAEYPGRRVPPALLDCLIASGSDIQALADVRERAADQVAALGADLQALRRWRGTDEMPFTDLPAVQAPLTELSRWAACARGALEDHLAARTAVTVMRKSSLAIPAAEELVAALSSALHVVEEASAIKAEGQAMQERYAAFYQGLNTNWNDILRALEWTGRLRALFPGERMPPPLVDIVTTGDGAVLADIRRACDDLRRRRDTTYPLFAQIGEIFPPERLQAEGKSLTDAPFPAVYDWLRLRLDSLSELERWIGFQNLRDVCSNVGLLSFFETTTHRVPPADQVVPAFRKRFHRLWLDAIADTVPALRQFRGDEHAARIARFAGLDLHQIESAPARVRARAASRRPASQSNFGEIGALRTQLSRKRPRPIRRLFQEIPNLLFSLKPCLLMSPLTVSLFLDPEKIRFDTVVFDEASQLFVQDAIGAMLRAPQAIIAGDTQQLPPTSFFLNLQDDDGDDEDEDAPITAGEFESVLKAAGAIAIEQSEHFAEHPLQWHYRSRHESLIAFSRKYFYEMLITFPSATPGSAVDFVHVPDGVYRGGRGEKRDNPVEASRVVDLVLAQARARPDLSIGVITFSQTQHDTIRAEVDARKRLDPQLEALLAEEGTEGFFVKNIETVQGDERDVIFLSVGYGPDLAGNLTMRFGPLNLEGGERRLNVAVTRARERCTVVSSMRPQDIVSDRLGPRRLRQYMELAQGGATVAESLLELEPIEQGDFERAVADTLTRLGYLVRHQIGLFDYRLDLAVLDPDDPSQYLLGIECDGVMYRDAETVRARERLRPDVLRRLGWRLVRLWSADWVRDPEGELRRLEDAIGCARRGEEASASVEYIDDGARPGGIRAGSVSVDMEDISDLATRECLTPSGGQAVGVTRSQNGLPPGVTYYQRTQIRMPGASEALYAEDDWQRVQFLLLLVEKEGPVAFDAAVQRLADAAGLARAGSRIRGIVEETVEEMARKEQLALRGGFLWPFGCDRPTPRVPRGGDTPRPIEYVCHEEVGELVVSLLKVAFGMRREELITETARLLGYRSAGVNIREHINETLSMLELDLRIHVLGGQIRALEL